MTILDQLDGQLLLWLRSAHCNFIDEVMEEVTGRRLWPPFYLWLVWFMVKRLGWQKGLMMTLMAGVAVGITDWTCASLIRPEIGCLRPSNLAGEIAPLVRIIDDYRGGPYGFPSCHAANTACLAAMVSLTLRQRWVTTMMVAWCILVSYSRVYYGVHYPGDLLAGWLVGCTIALILWKVHKLITQRRGPKQAKCPRLRVRSQ
ncbi:MAG: phosphatase PAP2 family protein [Bacteroidales bacterium]|nr:phosphatase PAP2 family protein [Bacteroidales bacterium]